MTRMLLPLPLTIRRFARDEQGVISVWSLFLFITICCIGAAAVDVTHFYTARAQLQVAADLAAHSALYTARYGSYDSDSEAYLPISTSGDQAAKDAAIARVVAGMPVSEYGTVIGRTDIILGRYNFTTKQVDSVDNPATVAVEYNPDDIDTAVVLTHRNGSSPVGSFLFRILGVDSMDVSTVAAFRLASGDCSSRQGFFSATSVAINSGNEFYPGFCIVTPLFWVQNGDNFHGGTTVMVPDECLNLRPHRCPVRDSNPGLEAALVDRTISLTPILDRINNNDSLLPEDFRSHAYAYDLLGQTEWLGALGTAGARSTPATEVPPGNLTPAQLSGPSVGAGTIYKSTCTGTQQINLGPSATSSVFRDFVLLTNCKIRFTDNISIQDAVISTINEGGNSANASFYGSEGGGGVTLGADDNCDLANNVALISRGNYDVAANSEYYGAHIAVDEGVDFQSNSEIQGIYIVAGGEINTTSNGQMRACGPGSDALSTDLTLRLIK